MARGRFISKTLGSSRKFEALGRVPKVGEFSQTLYVLLVANSDDFGRLPGDAFTAKFRIFPTSKRSTEDFDKAMNAMKQVGLIERYSVKGQEYAQVVYFEEHQVGLHKRTKSYFPEFPGISKQSQELPAQQEEESQQEVESKQESKQEGKACAAPSKSDDPPQHSEVDIVVMVFPTSGKTSTWPLMQSKIDEYRETYSALDVVHECKMARQWCVDNVSNRKTVGGMTRFLNRWLAKAQNESGNGNGRFRSRTVEPGKSIDELAKEFGKSAR